MPLFTATGLPTTTTNTWYHLMGCTALVKYSKQALLPNDHCLVLAKGRAVGASMPFIAVRRYFVLLIYTRGAAAVYIMRLRKCRGAEL